MARLQMVSYYKSLGEDQMKMGGVGQGGGLYWQESVGVRLQTEIAKLMDAEVTLVPRPHGKDSFDTKDYDPYPGEFDIAYCQLFECCTQKPAAWVYTMISDFLHMEKVLEEFLDRVRPDVVISLQYWRKPLWDLCKQYGARPVFLPWFNTEKHIYNPSKRNVGMCTGAMGGTYPRRDAIYKFLEGLGREDVVLSGSATGAHGFRLSDYEYRKALGETQYYLSGGIYDFQIPPKYYEVMGYGCCLVSHELEMMGDVGLIPGQTYVKIDDVKEIPDVLASLQWEEIGQAGYELVTRRHSLEARAVDIANVYERTR